MSREQRFQQTGFWLTSLLRDIDEMIHYMENPIHPILPVQDLGSVIAEFRIIRQMVLNAYNQLIEERFPRYPRFPSEKK